MEEEGEGRRGGEKKQREEGSRERGKGRREGGKLRTFRWAVSASRIMMLIQFKIRLQWEPGVVARTHLSSHCLGC